MNQELACLRRQGIKNNFQKGFTMMELLIVMGLVASVAMIGVVSVSRIKKSEDIATVAASVVNVLEEAHAKSLTGEKDRAWKVVMNAEAVTLQTEDGMGMESYNLPEEYMLVGPLAEVVFGRVDGRVLGCEAGCMYEVRELYGSLIYQIQILYSGAIEY